MGGAWENFYNLLIDYHIQKYGKDVVRSALEDIVNEIKKEGKNINEKTTN